MNNQIFLRINDEEKTFLSEQSRKYNIKDTQYLRMILDWFMTHKDFISSIDDNI